MNAPHMEPWNFDDWMALGRSDPMAFEERRRLVIEEAIARAPQRMRPRLCALQWRIDIERSRASNPLSACIRLYNMMWKTLCGENGLISAVGDLTATTHSPRHSAKVITFVRRCGDS